MRQVALWCAANAVAGIIFLIGLLSPLTPSEAQLAAFDLALFAVLPLGVCIGGAAVSQSPALRLLSAIEAFVIAGIVAWLYSIQSGRYF